MPRARSPNRDKAFELWLESGKSRMDTELMLVIRSKDINKQLEEGMMEYEKVSRQILEGGTYNIV